MLHFKKNSIISIFNVDLGLSCIVFFHFYLLTLTPKVLRVFFIKIASKQPLFKARWILQTWGLF
jgi:hypothetical protein